MKATIKRNANGSVTLTHDVDSSTFEDGRTRQSITYFCTGRYVFEHSDTGNHRQVCNKLQNMGCTLMTSKENLLETIRKEWRKAFNDIS